MEILKKPIVENCVWKVSDFKDENEWTYHFSDDEILELEDERNTILGEISRGIRFRGQNLQIPSISSRKLDFQFSFSRISESPPGPWAPPSEVIFS